MPDDTQLGSFPGGSGAPDVTYNPFDSNAGAPPPPKDVTGAPREQTNQALRTQQDQPPIAPVRQEPTAPPVRQAPPAPPAQQPPTQPPVAAAPDRAEELLQQLADRLRPPAAAPVVQAPLPPPPQLSDEEFARTFNIHKVTPEEYEAIIGIRPDSPARVAALDAALQAVSRQSVTIARALIEQKAQELGIQIAPVRQAMLQQEMRQHHEAFVVANPDLKDYTPLLQEIVAAQAARIQRGEVRNFANAQEAAQFVAKKARELLHLPAGGTSGAQPVTTQQPSSSQRSGSRSMSTTSMGGRTSQPGGAAPVLSQAERIFGGPENT